MFSFSLFTIMQFIIAWLLEQIYYFLAVVVLLLLNIAFLTLAERKLMATMQRRSGPNFVGPGGILQPFADGLKLLTKQGLTPKKAQRFLFDFAPIYTFTLALSGWVVIPFDFDVVIAPVSLGVIYLLAISTLGTYGIITAGWSSNSKYSFLGAVRSAAQMISYDVSMGLILLSVIFCASSCNLSEIVASQYLCWYIVPFWPLAFMFFVSCLAETNRAPFDLTECESELVSGYNTEYAGVGFTLFFLAEYSNMLLLSIYTAILFFGGWLSIFNFDLFIMPGVTILALKGVAIVFNFIWARGTLPRYRYDQLMTLGWKVFLPLALIIFILINFIYLFSFSQQSLLSYMLFLLQEGTLFYIYLVISVLLIIRSSSLMKS
jgi:NADH-quinone oxidoreductase subunit H